jgi:hypothetical protein
VDLGLLVCDTNVSNIDTPLQVHNQEDYNPYIIITLFIDTLSAAYVV